jgi:hypothetical protein
MKQYELIKKDNSIEILCISDIVVSLIEEKELTEKEVIEEIINKGYLSNVKSFAEINENNYVNPKEIKWEIRFDLITNEFDVF